MINPSILAISPTPLSETANHDRDSTMFYRQLFKCLNDSYVSVKWLIGGKNHKTKKQEKNLKFLLFLNKCKERKTKQLLP